MPSSRSGSTSNSIMSTPWASAASKLAERVARRDVVGALVADALGGRWSSLASRAPVGRAVGVALAARADRRRRSAGRGGPRGRRPGHRGLSPRAGRSPASAGAARAGSRAPRRRRPARRAPRIDLPACQQPSLFQRLPMPATVRWSSSASPIARVGSSSRRRRRIAPLVELAARGCPGPRPAIRWSSRVRESVISSSTGPSNCTTSRPRVLDDEPGAARAAVPARAVLVDAPRAGHAQVRVDRELALEAQEQVLADARRRDATARPASRSGQRSRREARVRRAQLVRDLALRGPGGSGPPRSGSCRLRAPLVEGTLTRCAPISPASSAMRTSCPATTRSTPPTRPRRAPCAAIAEAVVLPGRRRARSPRSSPGAASTRSPIVPARRRHAAGPAARCRAARASCWRSSG